VDRYFLLTNLWQVVPGQTSSYFTPYTSRLTFRYLLYALCAMLYAGRYISICYFLKNNQPILSCFRTNLPLVFLPKC